ncbi:hypothetical protein PFLG_01133 [Plasmodium falciparum RAJ116]|uniref:Pfmc-2TM Maurer's cleft two transmembrane protein n=1 Tax=Plasmodium falciparum RAJ116 TaxID=580058 RepID=A0A0L0CVH7_PLAFA|nr:hypothetical protein PFLG_01133 [Plasmodium falciparum RAJ116]
MNLFLYNNIVSIIIQHNYIKTKNNKNNACTYNIEIYLCIINPALFHISHTYSKTKDLDPQISSLVSLVDNMNITQEKKDKIKNLSLKYINSRDVKEKNESINELQKYSNNEECKEYMDSYLMHLRMQNDIKCLKRKNLWNNIGINSIILSLIIIMIACIIAGVVQAYNVFCPAFSPLIFIIYIVARYFPDMKIGFKKLKTKLNTFFQNKKQITK